MSQHTFGEMNALWEATARAMPAYAWCSWLCTEVRWKLIISSFTVKLLNPSGACGE